MNSIPLQTRSLADWEQIALPLAVEHWTRLGIISQLKKLGCEQQVAEVATSRAQAAVVAESKRFAGRIIIGGIIGLIFSVAATAFLISSGSGKIPVNLLALYPISVGAIVVGVVKLLASAGDAR